MAYSFRFYGRWPDQIDEEHPSDAYFSVAFKKTPTPAQKRKLGALWARVVLSRLDTIDSRQFWWSGPLAWFHVVGRYPGSMPADLKSVADAAFELDRICPVLDVVNHGPVKGVGRWDRWSQAQGDPVAGPAELKGGVPGRPVDPALGPFIPDDDFEAGYDSVLNEALERSASAPSAKKLALERTEQTPAGPVFTKGSTDPNGPGFDPQVWTPEVMAALEESPKQEIFQRRIPGTRVPAVFYHDKSRRDLGVARWNDGAWERLDIETRDGEYGSGLKDGVARPGGDGNFLLVTDSSSAFEVDLDSGASHRWFVSNTMGQYIADSCVLADGRRLVLVVGMLYVFDVDERTDEPRLTLNQSVKVSSNSSYTLGVARGGSVIICAGWGDHPIFFAYVKGALKRIGAFKGEGRYIGESAAGSILLKGAGGVIYEVTGIRESIEALEAKLAKAKKKRVSKSSKAGAKKTKTSKPTLVLEPAPWRDYGDAPQVVPEELEQRFPEQANLSAHPSGLVTGYWDYGKGFMLYNPHTDELEDLSDRLKKKGLRIWGCYHSADGSEIYFEEEQTLYAYDLAKRSFSTVLARADRPQEIGVLDSATVLGHDDLVARFRSGVAWLSRDEGWKILAKRKIPKVKQVLPLGEDATYCVVRTEVKDRLVALMIDRDKGKLKPAGKSQQLIDWLERETIDGKPVVFAIQRSQGQAWRLDLQG